MSWATLPQYIDPVLIQIGSVKVHWYGLMYLVAFLIVYLLVLYQIKARKLPYSTDLINDFMNWGIGGILVGGRLGYVLFYDLGYFLQHPLNIVSPFDYSDGFTYVGITGMSYHGALLGFVLATFIFCRRHLVNIWQLLDLFIPAISLGYTFGRVGNFLNGELYGRVTSVPWGMYFPLDRTHQLRHPSQLYEAVFEGIFLFLILWGIRNRKPFEGFLCGIYLIGYGLVRFVIEFFREPDSQIGFVIGSITLGQIFCVSMVAVGFLIIRNRAQRMALITS